MMMLICSQAVSILRAIPEDCACAMRAAVRTTGVRALDPRRRRTSPPISEWTPAGLVVHGLVQGCKL